MNNTADSPADGKLLIVDDDELFCQVLARAFTRRGYETGTAHRAADAVALARTFQPARAVLDLRLPGQSGLELIPELLTINRDMQIVVLTGYASITTAVEAIKLGALHYLTKPTDATQILAAFDNAQGNKDITIREKPMSLERLEWEHIQKVLADCRGNVSAAARELGMHRRTLQRKLAKRPVKFH